MTSNGKILLASGLTDWTTTGTGADRRLTRYLTQTLTFSDPSDELEPSEDESTIKDMASVYTCLPELGGAVGHWCFG